MWSILLGTVEALDLANHWRFYAPCLGGLAFAAIIHRFAPEPPGVVIAMATGLAGLIIGLVWEWRR
jgi:hypothetical protein